MSNAGYEPVNKFTFSFTERKNNNSFISFMGAPGSGLYLDVIDTERFEEASMTSGVVTTRATIAAEHSLDFSVETVVDFLYKLIDIYSKFKISIHFEFTAVNYDYSNNNFKDGFQGVNLFTVYNRKVYVTKSNIVFNDNAVLMERATS